MCKTHRTQPTAFLQVLLRLRVALRNRLERLLAFETFANEQLVALFAIQRRQVDALNLLVIFVQKNQVRVVAWNGLEFGFRKELQVFADELLHLGKPVQSSSRTRLNACLHRNFLGGGLVIGKNQWRSDYGDGYCDEQHAVAG